ncbi:MAG: tyrosine--tRNA ligase [Gemmatimonadetes bacterium]|nr:tyrosine--tRNA ligase [Gemmatimonadota bacterium]MBI3569480.1 tyrosine--tRNA ligase [Gemmatimonadota bacterium]
MTERANLLDELAWRGLVYQQTEGLAAHLAEGPRAVYCGYDPTAPSLHVGNLVPMMLLAHLGRAGHRIVALVGGGTALIGDPSGKSVERPLLDTTAADENAARIHAQLARVLEAAGARGVKMLDNADWLREVRLLDFLRDVGKHFSVNFLLAKDTVQSRLETGISYTEFSYMLTQAYDFLQLYTNHGVTLQVGGADQWGNITSGTELIRRAAGGSAHALTAPLLTTSSGKKFGKTEGGAVWLDAAMTSPYQFYQFWVNAEDADAGRFLRMFTVLSRPAIDEIERTHAAAPHERRAQKALAREVTTMIHGGESATLAETVSRIIFDKTANPADFGNDVFEFLRPEIPGVQTTRSADGTVDVLSILEGAFGLSRGAGKKLLQQSAVAVNGVKLGADEASIGADRAVHGTWFLVRKGARDIALARLV